MYLKNPSQKPHVRTGNSEVTHQKEKVLRKEWSPQLKKSNLRGIASAYKDILSFSWVEIYST